jgi:prophage regulatory protein
MHNTTAGPALLRMAEVTRTVGLSRATIYRLMERGQFPRAVTLTGSAVAWVRAEVEAWIAERVNARDTRAAA